MTIPFIGHMLISGLLMLNVYAKDWPVEATISESSWGLFGGGFASVSMLGYTYIADVTSEEERTARVSVLDAIMMLAKPLGNLIGAKVFLVAGYYPVFALSGFFAFVGALYVMVSLKETLPAQKSDNEKTTFWEVLRRKNPVTVVRTLARPRQGFRRRMILWSILTFLVHNLNYKGNLYLFTRKKFGWNEQDFSLYDSIDTIHGFTRALLVTPFLSKVLLVHDPMVGVLGALSWVTCFAVWSLATEGWMMYLATGLSSIGCLTTTPLITLLTKLVDKTEVGAVMAMASGMICLEELASSVLFSQVYKATVSTNPGFIFVVMLALYSTVALMFLVLLAMLFRQEKLFGGLGQEEQKTGKAMVS